MGKAGIVTMIVLLAGAPSCTPAGDGKQKMMPPPPHPRLGEHWAQSDRLAALVASKRVEAGTDDAFQEAAALAAGLADAAARIPRSVADHPMTADERRGFAAEAARLRDDSLQLNRAARGRNVEQIRRSLARVNATCVSCHGQYSEYAGELGTRKARAE